MLFDVKLAAALALSALATTSIVAPASAASPYRIGATTYSRSFEFYQDIEKGMKEEGGDKAVFNNHYDIYVEKRL